MNTASL